MDIPALRKNLDETANVQWLKRNMFIRNSNHPNFAEADAILRSL